MKQLIQAFCLIFISSISLFAQESDLLIGEWKNFYPYKYATQVTQNENTVYYGSSLSILVHNKNDNSNDFITRIEGLNDIDLGPIKYSPFKNTLIVTYSNGNIDLYRGKQNVINVGDLKSNVNILGRKSINHIYLQNDSLAILSADFGVMFLDLAKEEFKATIFTNSKPSATSIYKDTLFVSTDLGIYKVPKNINIQDFNQWIPFKINGKGSPYESTTNVVYKNAFYFSQNDTLWKYQNGGFKKLFFKKNFEVKYLSAEGNHLIAGMFCTSSPGCIGFGLIIDENDSIQEIHNSCFNRPISAAEDKNDNVWIGDEWDDFKNYNIATSSCSGFQVNSPNNEKAFDILISDNKTYITAGGLQNGSGYTYNGSGFYIYDYINKDWKNINPSNTPILESTFSLDLLQIAKSPVNGNLYIASYLGGLVEYDGTNVNVYNTSNSGLSTPQGDLTRPRVSGLAFDHKQNLWISNNGTVNPIVVFTKSGEWKNFASGNNKNFFQVAVDDNNNKWFVVFNGGLYVFNEGDDLNSTSDDKRREIDQSNSNLPTNTVNCVAVDKLGDVWVGTSQGPVVFECDDVFSNSCKGSKRIIQQDGFGAYLLETENIKVIKVDGANRKWFGTDNGLFVQSADGETQIYHFDTKNSPLSSNSITSIAFNDNNGEAWIGTNNGISVFRMEATSATEEFKSEVFAFPNPVRPDYTGPIVITGLAKDSNIKITDTTGKLVFETTSSGGQAIWDGKDYKGRKANSGVYLVFATSTTNVENPTAIVTKILVVN